MQFPDDLEPCRSGYSRNLLGEQYRNEFECYTRNRRKVRRRGVTDTLCWVATEDQIRRLEAFHRQAGGQYFTIELPDWQGFSDTTARFDSPLTARLIRDHYEISASLYIPAPDILADEELWYRLLELIGVYDDTFNDPLHEFVHNEWPDYWGSEA